MMDRNLSGKRVRAPYRRNKKLSHLLVWFITLASGAFLTWDLWAMGNALLTRSWPATPARIASSGYATSGKLQGNFRRASYYPDVAYRYHVAGKDYEGSRVHFRDLSTTAREAIGLAERFRKGETVSVYHHPRHPERAVLIQGISRTMLIVFGFVAAFFLAGIMILRHAKTKKN